MTTLNICGWEAGDLTEAHATAGSPSVGTGTVRTGQYALRVNPSSGVASWAAVCTYSAVGAQALLTRTAQAFYTFYFRFAALPATTTRFACVETNSGSPACRLNIASTGVITAQGATTSATVATVTTGVWYRADLRVTSNSTCGLAINGGTEQTCTANNVNQDRLSLGRFSTEANTYDCWYDDVLISDSGFPGAGQVVRLDPDGNGNYTGWTGGSGTTFAVVDDDVPGHDSDTTYIQCPDTADSTARTFSLESSSSAGVVGTILSVLGYAICRTESITSTSAVGVRMRNGTTDVDTTAQEWTTTYATKGMIRDTDPNGNIAWTSGGLDTLEIGVWAGSIAQAQRCTKVAVMVWSDGILAVSLNTIAATGTVNNMTITPGSVAVGMNAISAATTLNNLSVAYNVSMNTIASALAVNNMTIESGSGGIVDVPVAADADDAYWNAAGTFDATLTLVAFGVSSSVAHHTMLRFDNIAVPQGTGIISAYVTFVANSTRTTANVDAIISLVDEDDPTAPTTAANADGRSLTTATTTWNDVESMTAGVAYQTPSIVGSVQEIVDRVGWASGNAMVVFIKDNGSTNNHFRHISSIEHATDAAPILHIEYGDFQEVGFDTIAATGTVNNLTITPGTVAIGLNAISPVTTLNNFAVAYNISMDTIASALQMFEMAVSVGTVDVSLNTIAANTLVNDLTITPSQPISMETIASVAALYDLTVIPGTVDIEMITIASTASVNNLTVLPGGIAIGMNTIAAGTTLYNLIIPDNVGMNSISSTTALYNMTVASGATAIALGTITPETLLYLMHINAAHGAIFTDMVVGQPQLSIINGQAYLSWAVLQPRLSAVSLQPALDADVDQDSLEIIIG